jgi:hypothetical protein
VRDELLRPDSQRVRLKVGAVDTRDVDDPVLSEHLEPSARATAHVDNRRRLHPFDDQRDNGLRRPVGRVALPGEVGGVEIGGGLAKVGQAAIVVASQIQLVAGWRTD